jgi:hypothetical protein
MPYVRKTKDEWQIEQKTPEGWEEVCAEDSWNTGLTNRSTQSERERLAFR